MGKCKCCSKNGKCSSLTGPTGTAATASFNVEIREGPTGPAIDGPETLQNNQTLAFFSDTLQFSVEPGSVAVGAGIYPPEPRVKTGQLNELRCLLPNEPEQLGTSTKCVAVNTPDCYPLQAYNNWSTNCKLELESEANKISIPSLGVKASFQMVPTAAECTADQNAEIVNAGYESPPFFFARTAANNWYGATADDEFFYYSVYGNSKFAALFGFGVSSIYVCRRKSDASLVWVKNIYNFLVTQRQNNFLGNDIVLSTMNLAIHNDRLYTTCMITNIGPQLFCLDKITGEPIWSIAYYTPRTLIAGTTPNIGQSNRGQSVISPTVPFGTFDGSLYIFPSVPVGEVTVALGDLNLQIAELGEGRISIFVGVSSFQNSLNPSSLSGAFAEYLDQGYLIRIDDTGALPVMMWSASTCAPILVEGNTITSGGLPSFDPFRPAAQNPNGTVCIWRDSPDGFFDPAGDPTVTVAPLDYTLASAAGGYPGYRPIGFPTTDNLTIPVTYKFTVPAIGPVDQTIVPSIFWLAAPGIGAGAVIYQNDMTTPIARTITDLVTFWNANLGSTFVVWAYISGAEITAFDAGATQASNIGLRYVAQLTSGHILNAQEAKSLNYYGNSIWAQAPTLDYKHNKIYQGTGQTHGIPLDETFALAAPSIDYFDRKQPVLNALYGYSQTNIAPIAPIMTLSDIQEQKDIFSEDTVVFATPTLTGIAAMSPRGFRSYCDAIMCWDLYSGSPSGTLDWAFRTYIYDAETFVGDEPNIIVLDERGLDADASSGVHYFQDIQVEGGSFKSYAVACTKGSLVLVVDISGVNSAVTFDHTNPIEKGIVPTAIYGGSDGTLGGSNYGSAQSCGNLLITSNANAAPVIRTSIGFGSRSQLYTNNFNQGFEFMVTQSGEILQIQNSIVQAFDISRQQIVWETPLGQRSHSVETCTNGIVFGINGDGVLFGFDIETGKIVWKLNVIPFGCGGGLTCPIFCGDCAIIIPNYSVAGTGGVGANGLLLAIDTDNLPKTTDTPSTIMDDRSFTSYDINPKADGTDPFQALVIDDVVTHIWTGSSVLASHTITGTSATFVAGSYNSTEKSILFVSPIVQNNLKYLSIDVLNKNTYILNYQYFSAGIWNAKAATFGV